MDETKTKAEQKLIEKAFSLIAAMNDLSDLRQSETLE